MTKKKKQKLFEQAASFKNGRPTVFPPLSIDLNTLSNTLKTIVVRSLFLLRFLFIILVLTNVKISRTDFPFVVDYHDAYKSFELLLI